MAGTTFFVPTDADGTQHHAGETTKWPLPTRAPGADGAWEPGETIELASGVIDVLLDLDGLLDELGERIFVAEWLPESGGSKSARLVAETGWTLHAAARFALECVERVVPDADGLKLPSGTSVGDIFTAAHAYLTEDEAAGTGLLQRMSRIAIARRLRHLGDEVGDEALTLTVEDEGQDLDALDDPAWAAVAAVRDAVLSVVEAIRHDAFPKSLEIENSRYESEVDTAIVPPQVISTPWGSFVAGRKVGVVPGWVAARDAAERARQAMTDTNGQEVGDRVRAWQRDRLTEALGGKNDEPVSD